MMYTDDRHLSPLMSGGVPRFVVNRFIVDTVFVTRSIRFDSLLDGIMRKAHRNRPLAEAQHELTELLHRWYTVFFELTESG